MNNFTPRAQQVLALARKEADRFNHNYVGTEHLLLGLVRLNQGVAVNVLQKLGLDLETLRREVEKQVGPGPVEKMSGNIPYTPRVKKVLALAGKEAKSLGHSYVGTEHILLGILRENDGVSARVLRTLGVDMEGTRTEILRELDPSFGPYPNSSSRLISPPESPIKYSPAMAATMAETAPNHPSLNPYLFPGEKLLWSGAPKRKFRFERKHLPLLFFFLPFIAFMLIPIIGVLSPGTSQQSKSDSTVTQQVTENQNSQTPPAPKPTLAGRIFLGFFVLLFFGGIFSFIVLGLVTQMGGGSFWQGEKVYGVTNQRLIFVTGRKQKVIHSVHLGTATDVRMKEWPDGLGTISFGPDLMWPYAAMPSRNSGLQLENISEPGRVFQIILQARRGS